MARVSERIALLNAALADAPESGVVRFGLAELQPTDLPEDLVERASSAIQLTRDSSNTASPYDVEQGWTRSSPGALV